MSRSGTSEELFENVVRQENLSVRVAAQLESLIFGNRLSAGERLPSERILAERFGVSRTVVREAVQALVAKGLLEVSSGSGIVVSSLEPDSAAEFMSGLLSLRLRSGKLDFNKVIEVRRMLEVDIAALAAQRRTESAIEGMEAILRQTEANLGDSETFVETDVSFHEALARATQNELLPLLLSSISDVLVAGRRMALGVPSTAERALAYHWQILEHVRANNSEGAREAMDAHMDEARDTMWQALADRAGE